MQIKVSPNEGTPLYQQIVTQVKEDVERLEKQLEIVHSLPKPDVLEQAKLASTSQTTQKPGMKV